MNNYQGAFNPDLQLTDFDHGVLANYGRDIMLANHIHDRSALSQVAVQFGAEGQTAVACDEWMSSSPIYNQRIRELMNISGDDVSVALKGLQLDIGAPHNYLNFHYELTSPDEGYFWTSTCGPYNYMREMTNADEQAQIQICHHMEDPTFDATVMAVNPLMRCRPVYRPPVSEVPERGPCKWLVSIQRDIGLVEDCPNLDKVRATRAANFEFTQTEDSGDGLPDYSGEFLRDMCLEKFSHSALGIQCKEFMLDVLLLNYACYTSIVERFGEDQMHAIAGEQWRALAPVTVHRLRNTFGITGDDMGAALKCLQLNPFIPWEYCDLGMEQLSASRGRIWLRDCEAYRESIPRGLAGRMLTHPEQPGFEAIAQAVNPRSVIRQIDAAEIDDNAVIAWELEIDTSVPAAERSSWADIVGQNMWDLDNSSHRYRYEYYDALAGQQN